MVRPYIFRVTAIPAEAFMHNSSIIGEKGGLFIAEQHRGNGHVKVLEHGFVTVALSLAFKCRDCPGVSGPSCDRKFYFTFGQAVRQTAPINFLGGGGLWPF